MSASIHFDPDNQICELHIRGTLKRAEFASCESELADHISAGAHPRMLVILQNFGGWERGEGWNNLDFMFTHGAQISKIAIVGAGTKEAEIKAFAGAGLRPSPVEFFATEQQAEARVWLLA